MTVDFDDSAAPAGLAFTVTVPFSRAGLLELRRRIDELLGQVPSDLAGGDDLEERADQKAAAIARRLGGTSWDFLLASAAAARSGREFTLEEIADQLGPEHPIGKVKAYHRNVSRSEKQVDLNFPGAPPLFTARWDGERNWYSMPGEIADALLNQPQRHGDGGPGA
jgi:hypothetical protein